MPRTFRPPGTPGLLLTCSQCSRNRRTSATRSRAASGPPEPERIFAIAAASKPAVAGPCVHARNLARSRVTAASSGRRRCRPIAKVSEPTSPSLRARYERMRQHAERGRGRHDDVGVHRRAVCRVDLVSSGTTRRHATPTSSRSSSAKARTTDCVLSVPPPLTSPPSTATASTSVVQQRRNATAPPPSPRTPPTGSP
jgi:hypothetical protein